MARPINTIKNINDSQMLWRIAVRVTDKWSVFNRERQEHLQMIFMDACGDKIQAVCASNDVKIWKPLLKEQSTYLLENFMVFPNDLQYKLCDHAFKLVICSGTLAREKDLLEIPPATYVFKEFGDILKGSFREDLLVDVIGAVQNRVINQMHNKPRKIIISLRDLSGNNLSCTLWEAVAQKFLQVYDNLDKDAPVVMILTHTRVRPAQGKYQASLSSSLHGCKVLLNDDISQINDFRNSWLMLNGGDLDSQMSTQVPNDSQFTERDRFCFMAPILSIHNINELTEDMSCVTVGTTGKLLPNGAGWCYDACSACPKGTKISTGPFCCQGCGNSCDAAVPRYKLEIQVYQGKDSYRMMFWDKQCRPLLGISANELWKLMLEEGETDRRSYPAKLDSLLAITMMLRVRVQPHKSQIYVSRIDTEQDFIDKVLNTIKSEQTSKLAITNTHFGNPDSKQTTEGSSPKGAVDSSDNALPNPNINILEDSQIQSVSQSQSKTNFESNQEKEPATSNNSKLASRTNTFSQENEFPPVSLSGSSEHDPEVIGDTTPAKRLSSERQFDDPNLSAQHSSTKVAKFIKKEPK